MKTLFLTGAGISANAGIATYRDSGSSWRDEDLEKKSHASVYGNHLDELWDKHWGPAAIVMRLAEPTYTHKAIAEFQKKFPETIVATQNIDSLHERAGSDNVAHIHGSMNTYCIRCKRDADTDGWIGDGAPLCKRCNKKKTRPSAILFGEMPNRNMFKGLSNFAKTANFVVSVGTSLNVFPAATLVMDNINRSVIVNKEPTKFDKWCAWPVNDDCDDVIDGVLSEIANFGGNSDTS